MKPLDSFTKPSAMGAGIFNLVALLFIVGGILAICIAVLLMFPGVYRGWAKHDWSLVRKAIVLALAGLASAVVAGPVLYGLSGALFGRLIP